MGNKDYSKAHSITDAIREWQRGDDRAGFDLDRRLRADLLALVRSRRNEKLRARIDSEAVVNAALKSFLSGARADEFPQLTDRQDAKRLLAHFAICVLRDQVKRETADKRDYRKTANPANSTDGVVPDGPQWTPEDCAVAVEYWEKFPEVVREVHEKSIEVLEQSLEGLTPIQIARELGLGVRTVQRIIQDMISAWNRWLVAEEQHGSAATDSRANGQ